MLNSMITRGNFKAEDDLKRSQIAKPGARLAQLLNASGPSNSSGELNNGHLQRARISWSKSVGRRSKVTGCGFDPRYREENEQRYGADGDCKRHKPKVRDVRQ